MGLLDKWFKKKKEDQLGVVKKHLPKVKDEKKSSKPSTEEAGEKKEKKKATGIEAKQIRKTGSDKKSRGESDAYGLLVRPIVSEKAASLEAGGVYSFRVNKNASKQQIKQAIESIYGVRPKKIGVMNMEGKKVRFGRQQGRRSDWKKAVIYLPKGQTINVHEGV